MLKKILNNRIIILYCLPLLLGALTVFSFQPFNLSFINFILLPVFFSTIVYVRKRSQSVYRKKPFRKNLFLLGFLFGFGFYLSGIFWISYSLTFDESFKFLIPFAIILIPLFLGLFTGVTTLIIGQYLNFNFSSILLFSGALAFSDYLRGKILSGFPWNIWAYSWSWLTEILQILNYIGLYAFNILVITIFTIPALLFFRTSVGKKILVITSSFIFVFLVYIYGTFSINKNKGLLDYFDDTKKVYTKVISPNFELKYNTSLVEIENKLKKLVRYSDPDLKKTTLFIWPEGIFTGYSFNEIAKFSDLLKDNFNKNHLILFGINTKDEVTGKYFNSLVIVDNNFKILHQYNKIKLVPFGEFLPFENILNKFGLKKITQGHSSFSKGKTQKNIIINGLNILPMICYEIIFTEITQKTDENTNLIVNISEDGWFGSSIGPYQHFAKAIFRSIENNSFLVRSANQGITAIINNKGEVVKELNINETGNIEMNIPVFKSGHKNKNDLIFFILLFTYLTIFLILKNKK
ncbi:apolipoprotein N-acyltransferase [Candidatus Pelagibacter bacterium]|nr:apolipoprotein N-acyltransferase [Candidatus Pelagibacter bacterium]MDA9624788.1 apolipoprotein N-acyltransferase [Candidatus Pelagibacter bacterium]